MQNLERNQGGRSVQERILLRCIAEERRGGSPDLTTGALYAVVKQQMTTGYTTFYERLQKLGRNAAHHHRAEQQGRESAGG